VIANEVIGTFHFAFLKELPDCSMLNSRLLDTAWPAGLKKTSPNE